MDVAAAKEAYEMIEVSIIGLVDGKDNPGDALTKPNLGCPLMNILIENADNTMVKQWVIREASNYNRAS